MSQKRRAAAARYNFHACRAVDKLLIIMFAKNVIISSLSTALHVRQNVIDTVLRVGYQMLHFSTLLYPV